MTVLNGTSSAGKTSLARTIQQLASTLWLVVGQDDFAQQLVPRWVHVPGTTLTGDRGEGGFQFVRGDDGSLHVEVGEVGRRLLRGYRFAVAGCARAGNDVVVDECMFDAGGWDEWQDALDDLRVLWVRVECALEVCERREVERDDRRSLAGLARGQYERAHAGVSYDITVDLSDGDLVAAARAVLLTADALPLRGPAAS